MHERLGLLSGCYVLGAQHAIDSCVHGGHGSSVSSPQLDRCADAEDGPIVLSKPICWVEPVVAVVRQSGEVDGTRNIDFGMGRSESGELRRIVMRAKSTHARWLPGAER